MDQHINYKLSHIHMLGVVKRNPLFLHEILNGKIMDFFLLHLIL